MKHAAIFLLCCLVAILLSSCSEVVSREAVEYRYIPAYNELIIEYVNYSDPYDGESYDERREYTIHHAEVYEIQYRITYRNGNVAAVWEAVTKEKYNEYIGGESR